MKKIKGKSVCEKINMGTAKVIKKDSSPFINTENITDVSCEFNRLSKAILAAEEELSHLYIKVLTKEGSKVAEIFNVQRMLLSDELFLDDVEKLINEEMISAEFAVYKTAEKLRATFLAMKDEYMQVRAADVLDISNRVISNLTGVGDGEIIIASPCVIVAEDITPSQMASFDKEKLLGFVIQEGSVHSHMAILAKSLGIPALVTSDFVMDDISNGETVIVDGVDSIAYFSPDEEVINKYSDIINKTKDMVPFEYVGKNTVSLSGRQINLYANANDMADLKSVSKNDSEGIGLFRTEFLYINRDFSPTEEEQYEKYKQIVEGMEGKPVVFRTFDFGGDKQCGFTKNTKEANPAMGLRGIRFLLYHKDVFLTQMKALLRVSCLGEVYVMLPMITSKEELDESILIIRDAKAQLDSKGIACKDFKLGIMIETPASVLIADELAQKCDFFSIGTNDLTQYTLAMDRENSKLDMFYKQYHPAVFKLIEMTVEAAHSNGIKVGICGEIAGNMNLTEKFMDMGIDYLSVEPSKILFMREKISNFR